LSRRCGARSSSTAFAWARSRPDPVITALLKDWPAEKLQQARESGSLLEASEVANVVTFMLTRPRRMTIRDVIMMPTNFDLWYGEFEVPISLCTALPGHIGRLSDSI
jgi:NADP-dependent 3-hydroxy acid dehydrogenase YdfG